MIDYKFKVLLMVILCVAVLAGTIGMVIGYSIADNPKPLYNINPDRTLKQEIDAWEKERWARYYVEWWDDYNNKIYTFKAGDTIRVWEYIEGKTFTEYLKQRTRKEKGK